MCRLSLVVVSRGHSLVVVCGLLIQVASLVAEHQFWGARASVIVHRGSVVVAHKLSARGILPAQGSNACLLHWQVDSLPLRHQESPELYALNCCVLLKLSRIVWGLPPYPLL